MKESNSIMYFNIIKVIFVGIISGIFLKFCILNTAVNKEIKVDLLDFQKYGLYAYYVYKYLNNQDNKNNVKDIFNVSNLQDLFNKIKEQNKLYKEECMEHEYINKIFIAYCTIIYGYVFYHTWDTLNNLENLKKSKEIYEKENPAPMMAVY